MLRFLFDTDHLTLYDQGDAHVVRRLATEPPGSVGVSAVTVEEYLRGRLGALARARDGAARIRRYALLLASVRLFHLFPLVSFDQAAENLYQQLRHIRVGTQDLKIAAVALANHLTLLTRNRRDFGRIPGLVLDDWSV
jgi:tRNA(fMet)-specific endonuclease VapC